MHFEVRKDFCLGSLEIPGNSHLKLGLFRFVWDEDSVRCYWVSRDFAGENSGKSWTFHLRWVVDA